MHCPKRAPSQYLLHSPAIAAPIECSRKATIEKLSDEVLQTIFRHCLDSSPRFWPVLVHICRKWRHVVLVSHRALRLRLFCTRGTPVLKALDLWPALPIALEYGGSPELNPPAPEDEENILAALNRSDRVSSIHLTVTKSLLEKLSAIRGQFSELEELVLLSRSGRQLSLPRTFLWAPRLRRLHSTRVAFSAPLQLLSSSRDLVDIQLHDISDDGCLSPMALADALSRMAQLRSLSLRVRFTAILPMSKEHVVQLIVIPSLSCLKYQGTSKYLDSLLSRLDAPRLADIEITFFAETRFNLSNFKEFINRTEMPRFHGQADILFTEGSVSISSTQSVPTSLKLQVLCDLLNRQVVSMSQLCSHLASFYFRVDDIRIEATGTRLSSWRYEMPVDCETWAALIRSFKVLKCVRLAGDISIEIMRALSLSSGRHANMLPVLSKLCIYGPWSSYPPLRELVVSLMVDRRRSRRPIEVEYEQCVDDLAEHGTGPFYQRVTIEILADDVLLDIFLYYLDWSPQSWPTLAHVCQRWRQIILMSPHSLDLRLYCTYGTPVLKSLVYWPPLPLVLNYGGTPRRNPPAPEDEENIVAALKQSDQVRIIRLTVTCPLVEKISTISEPLSELKELVLHSRDNLQLTLPSAFRWGPHLRILHSTRVALPALPQLLSPPTDLVDLQLHEIPKLGNFCPQAFANSLSGASHLETISLHFLSLLPRRNHLRLPLQSANFARIVLPALTRLKYRGTSKFLDSFVARIDAPHLEDIDITFSSQPTMDASQLGRFIERTEMQISLLRADIKISAHAISISFTDSSISTPLRIQIPCKQLNWKLSSMAQVCGQCSPFLSRFHNLGINTAQSSSEHDDVDGEQWLELFCPFGRTRSFRVTGELTADILCALGKADSSGGHATVLPALRHLRVGKPLSMYGPSWDAVQSSIASRLSSGRPVTINAPSYLCHVCRSTFTKKQKLKSHLVQTHAYRIVCSYCEVYCGDFERLQVPGYDELFREHLASKHLDVSSTDRLRAKDIFGLFTKLKPPVFPQTGTSTAVSLPILILDSD